MKSQTKALIGVFALTLLIIVVGVFLLSKNSPQVSNPNSSTVYQIDYSKGHKIGSDSAKVKLIEFSDFQCPACLAAESVVEDIIASEKGKDFQFIYRNYPLTQHLNSKAAVNAAEAASAQSKFWEMHHKLFETQSKWEGLAAPADFFATLAKDLGMDGAKIKEAVEKNSYNNIIQADTNDGNAYGLSATPTFYLNGKKQELSSFGDLKTEIEKALQ